MGVVKNMVRLGRSNAAQREENEATIAAIRDSSLEDGLRQMLATIGSLQELDSRITELEGDLLGEGAMKVDPMPTPAELGLTGFVPRLMEASLLIGAYTRRMHLRMGVIEGALGKRARPVTDASVIIHAPKSLENRSQDDETPVAAVEEDNVAPQVD